MFLREASEWAREIEQMAASLRLSDGGTAPGELRPGDASEALREVAHRLRGSGGLYGFGRISDAAAEVEEAVRAGRSPAVLARAAERLVRAIRAARA